MHYKCFIFVIVLLVFKTGTAQSILFSEDFDSANLKVTASTSGTGGTWDLCSTFSKSGTFSDSAKVSIGDSLFLRTDTFNTSSFNYVSLEFNQICKIDFFDKGIIEYSIDSGATWTGTTASQYLGVGTLFQNSFSSISYTDWMVASGTATPTQNWWKKETFNLDAIAGYKNVMIRFVLIDADNNGAMNNYGWVLDDIKIVASSCELIPPYIQLTGNILQGSVFNNGPFKIEANITDTSGIADAFIVYQKNFGASDTVVMTLGSNGRFEGLIPSAATGDTICYLVYAIDSSSCKNLGVLQVSNCLQFILKSNPAPTCNGNTITNFDYFENLSGFTAGNGFSSVGTLKSNWENATGDDHEWFVYDNQAPSYNAGTGPFADHSPNDNTYLYIEASGHNQQTANLITPCFDLSNLSVPQFSFWYHMNGTDMGELHLDVYFGGKWVDDVMPKIDGNQGNTWQQQKVDLSLYKGNTIKLRFRGITGNGYRSDIAIDDIELKELPLHNIELKKIIAPSDYACNGTANEPISITIFNRGGVLEDTIPLNYKLNGNSIVKDTAFVNLFAGDSLNFTFSQTVDMTVSGNYVLAVWADLALDGNRLNDSILNYSVEATPLTNSFPDTTDFDNFTVGIPGVFFDDWGNSQSNRQDWYVNKNTTPSNFTGPSGDHTSGNGNYVYMEATGLAANSELSLESNCFDLSNLNAAELQFSYHMNGVDMGELHLDILENKILIQDIINPISGNQGTNWKDEVVDLSAYTGNVKLIFRAVCGIGYRSDIALDDVILRDAQPVGINESVKGSSQITIYPNPTKEYFYLSTEKQIPMEVYIYDFSGKLVLHEFLLETKSKISLNNFAAGIYFLSVKTANSIETAKIIKQ